VESDGSDQAFEVFQKGIAKDYFENHLLRRERT
jgi:hypothetical protein